MRSSPSRAIEAPARLDPAHHLLGRANRQRRVRGDRRGQLADRRPRCPGSAMRVTRPSAAASAASMSRAVKSRSLTRAGPSRSTSRA